MLTPNQLRDLPEDVVDIFKDCEDEILRKIGEKISKTGELSTANTKKLKSLKNRTLLQEDITKTLQEYSGRSSRELRKLFKDAGELSLLDDDKTTGERYRSKKMNDLLNAISRQTEGTMQNMTRTTARNATNEFYKELDKAVLSIKSGASTQEQAIKRCIDNLADKMDYVEYNGRRDTLEVAVRRAVRTGLNQLTAELTLLRCEELGIEFVEVSAHAGARTSKTHDCTNHAWWQGKVYHIGKDWGYARKRAYPPLMAYHFAGYGYGEGLCGWNCRHSFRPYIPYVTKRRYTERDVQRLNKESVTYSGRKYTREQIDQIQRYYERQVRKYKRRAILAKSAGDQTEYVRADAKVKEWENALKDLVKQTGGHRELGREYIASKRQSPFDGEEPDDSLIESKTWVPIIRSEKDVEIMHKLGISEFKDQPSIEEAVKTLNVVNGVRQKKNCQRSVWGGEAYFRGFDVKIKPQIETIDHKDYFRYIWVPEGEVSYTHVVPNFKEDAVEVFGENIAEVMIKIEAEVSKNEKYRGILFYQNKKGGAHALNVINYNGSVRYIDFETCNVDYLGFFNRMDTGMVFLTRVDHKDFTDIIGMAVRAND